MIDLFWTTALFLYINDQEYSKNFLPFSVITQIFHELLILAQDACSQKFL
jgi:hypothetical protein